jgi:hypothetical protein
MHLSLPAISTLVLYLWVVVTNIEQLLQTLGSCYKQWAAVTNIGDNLKKTS